MLNHLPILEPHKVHDSHLETLPIRRHTLPLFDQHPAQDLVGSHDAVVLDAMQDLDFGIRERVTDAFHDCSDGIVIVRLTGSCCMVPKIWMNEAIKEFQLAALLYFFDEGAHALDIADRGLSHGDYRCGD